MSQVTRLRRATAADVERLVEVARAAWLSAFADTAPPELISYWRANDREPAWYARYWPDMTVATVADLVVGVVQPAADEVNGLWVAPQWQGRGIGSRLLDAAEGEIRDGGHPRAWLSCSSRNARATGFYQSRGYLAVSKRTEVVSGNLTDEMIILEKML